MNISDTTEEDFITINHRNIFFRYRAGRSNVYLTFLHGYPTSSLDYVQVIDRIPKEYHVLVHDQLGFGLSDKPLDIDYQISEQADIVCDLYNALNIKELHLIAHDYGTSVATELIARNNKGELKFNIRSVTLCNGSMLIDMSKLRLIQKLLKNKWIGNLVAHLSSESTFQRNMKNIWFDKEKYNKEIMSKHWSLLIRGNGRKVLSKVTRYIDQRYIYYGRWIGGLAESRLPFHILWAENDPVAVKEMAYKLDRIIRNSRLTIIRDCGHYPMMEKEEEWSQHLISFINNLAE